MANGKTDLINVAHCTAFAKRWAQNNRKGWLPDRVSKRFLEDLNVKVRLMIQHSIDHHRSCGKTIIDFNP